ncbi:sensor histidine kinase [Lutibacter sp. B2]|nr:sensor histidine kinase [Lutibacter sp. B2]
MINKDLEYDKIVKKILVFTVLTCTVLTATLIYFSNITSKKIMFELMEDSVRNDFQLYAEAVDGYLNTKINVLKNYAKSPIIKNENWEKIEPYLNDRIGLKTCEGLLKEECERYEVLFIVDQQGNMYSTDGKKDYVGDEKYFKLGMEGKETISNLFISKDNGALKAIITVPIENNEKKIVGLLGGVTNLETLNSMMSKYKINHKDAYTYIVDKNGFVVSHPNKEFIMKENITIISKNVSKSVAKSGIEILSKDNGIVQYSTNGISVSAYFYSIPNTDHWKIVIKVPKSYLYKPIKEKTNELLIIGVIGIMIIGVVSLIVGQLIATPMLKLKKDVEENKKLLKERIEYDKLKTEFFSNISHELKTPLNIIFATTQLLKLYTQDHKQNHNCEKVNKYMDVMKQNGNRLIRLIDNLIDITKIDTGFMNLNLQNRNIVEVVEDITLSTVEYVESKSKNIIFDTEIEEKVMAFDPDKIERIILNLISNAIKFTDEGDQIEVNIYDREEKILISVKDTGIGIPKDKQDLIFERFRQVDPILTRQAEGSGIGLSLVKSFVEMHEGNISLQSECNKGTEIIIELPVKIASEEYKEPKGNNILKKDNIEKIDIEFSDIYS